MDDETRQAFRQTANAFGETAQAFQNTAQAFQNTAEAFAPPQQSPDPPPPRPPTVNPAGVLTAVILGGYLIALIIILWPPPPQPPPYGGIDDGLVFARCDEPMLRVSEQSVELWGVDADSGSVIDRGRADVELPEHSRLAYPCDTVGGLARRLFDAGFRTTVVQVSDPDTGAAWVGEVSLTARDPAAPTAPQQPSTYHRHPHDGLAVYGPDGRTVWYRSANDGSVHRVQESVTEDVAVTIDPAAEAFTVLTDDPARLFVQGDRTTDRYAPDLALPNPTGDMAAAPGMLYLVDEGRAVPLRCSTLVRDAATPCLRGDLGRTGAIHPAAWLDDRTLLAINGPRRGSNVVLRIEMDDAGPLRACAATPTTDWSHRAVAVDPHEDRFVTDAVRDGQRALFYWPTDETVDVELNRVEPPRT